MLHSCMCSLACRFHTSLQLAADRPKVKGLIGGLPPASALWNLQLALAYYSTSQARLISDLSTVAGSFCWISPIRHHHSHAAFQSAVLDTLECNSFPATAICNCNASQSLCMYTSDGTCWCTCCACTAYMYMLYTLYIYIVYFS